MADAYVCPVEGKSYPDLEEFLNHAVVAHGHRPNDDDCGCKCCIAVFGPNFKEETHG